MPKKKRKDDGPSLNRLSPHAVRSDQFDRQDFDRLMKDKALRPFRDYRDKLAESPAGDNAYPAWQDTFLSLHKVDPKLLDADEMRPKNRVNRRVAEELFDLPDHKDIRVWTQGDPVGAALACNVMEPDLETIFDRLKNEQRMAEELQELMQQLADMGDEARDLDEMIEDWTTDHPDEENDALNQQRQDLQDKIDELQKQADEQDQTLEELLDQASPDIRAALRQGIQQAAQQASSTAEMAATWGMEPGDLTRLNAQERMNLARRLNNDKFRRVAELFGPMKRLAFSEQRRRVNYAPEEIFDIELGANIPRLLPNELMKLGDPDLELLFLKRYRERALLQYAMRGHERVAKGGIIYIYDGSWSMAGEKEIWSKALGLTLLHIARKQKRSFVAIQFGSRNEIMVHDFRDGDLSYDRVLDMAEFFFAGGTDFERPLSVGLEFLEKEHAETGALKSDIVFCSDGECGVSAAFLDRWEAARKKLGMKVWGINLDNRPDGEPMKTICAGSVATVKTLMNGDSVRTIFGGL